MHKTLVSFLVVISAVFAAIGLAVFAAPTAFAAQLDMTVTSATAVADFRAVYGGVSFAAAAFAVMALRNAALRPAAVWAFTLMMEGLLLGRLFSWATHGPGNALIFAQLGLELLAATWGFLLTRAQTWRNTVQSVG